MFAGQNIKFQFFGFVCVCMCLCSRVGLEVNAGVYCIRMYVNAEVCLLVRVCWEALRISINA